MKKIAVVFGTRPSVIKLAPVVKALRARGADVTVICTGQHTDLVDSACRSMGLTVDRNLDIFEPGQTPNSIVARTMLNLTPLLTGHDCMVTVGDTSSALGAALCAFHAGIPVAHVEAGLRTSNLRDPFPEEMNRVVIDIVATWRFAPTWQAFLKLPAGWDNGVWLVGNTIVDAVRSIALASRDDSPSHEILVTAHRRENWDRMEVICHALTDILLDSETERPELRAVWVHHANPQLRRRVEFLLEGAGRVEFSPPMEYTRFIARLKRAAVVLTDSGGVQEECAILGRHCVVMRDTTERPEGVAIGVASLAGVNRENIVRETLTRLATPQPTPSNCYGDGRAADRIADILLTGNTHLGEWNL